MTVPPNPFQAHETFQYKKAGQASVLEYMASGLPYVTQSTVGTTPTAIEFPFVTKFFTVRNGTGGDLHVGFTANGVTGSNRFTLGTGESFTGEIRVKDLFVMAAAGTTDFEVIAGLTGILARDFFILTGSFVGFSGSQELFGYRGFGYDGIG